MKVYELLTLIAKGEVMEGTEFEFDGKIIHYSYNEFDIWSEKGAPSIEFRPSDLSKEIKIIKLVPDINVGTIEELNLNIERFRYYGVAVGEELQKVQLKLNEVIRKINKGE